MPLYRDQINRLVDIPFTPKRIVSLVPSQTELLYDLGLRDEVVAITKFCVHPHDWFQTKTRIGGTKDINIEKIKSLNPDLIIASKEENVKEQIEALEISCPVWVSDVIDLPSALTMIAELGRIMSKEAEASRITTQINTNFRALHFTHKANPRPRTAYLIWREPFLTVGGDTFINHMLECAGFENIFANQRRYPEIEIGSLPSLGCEVLLLSSEPYPFKQKHLLELEEVYKKAGTNPIKIKLVDGEMFSWYGSRLIQAPAYFKTLHD